MLNSKASASVAAKLQIGPPRSQNLLLVLAIGALTFLAWGCAALMQGWLHPEAPFIIGGVLLVTVACGWFRSQGAVDLDGAPATVIQASKTGVTISADPRTIDHSRESLIAIAQLVTYQRPLPVPDGLVKAGSPQPDSVDEARQQVQEINTEQQRLMAARHKLFTKKRIDKPASASMYKLEHPDAQAARDPPMPP
jgi:hypothetical protein